MAVTAAKKQQYDEKSAGGNIRSVRIEVGENGGAVVNCEREPPKRDKSESGMMMDYRPAKPVPFTTMEEAVHYAAKELGVDVDMESDDKE